MRIIDSHAHFIVKGHPIFPGYFDTHGAERAAAVAEQSRRMREDWRRAWRFPEPEPPSGDIHEIAARWLKDMDRKGVERMVFLTASGNEDMARIVALAPERFIGLAYHDITSKDAARELERAITSLGLKGLKVFAPLVDVPLSDSSLFPVYEVAEHYQVPILIHFGILGGAGGIAWHMNISPMSIHDAAKAFPRIPFIVPHFGCGHPRDALFLAWACPNVHIDTSGSNQWMRFMPYPLTVRDMFLKCRQTIGAERILFGTDAMTFPRGIVSAYLDSQVRDCVELGFSEQEVDAIFYGNAARLYKVEGV